MYGASDKFNFKLRNEDESGTKAKQNSSQYAVAANYNKVWDNGSSTKLLASYSHFDSDQDHVLIPKGQQKDIKTMHVNNRMQEFTFDLSHQFDLGKHQNITIGTEWNQYMNRLNGEKRSLCVPALYAIDNIKIDKLNITGSFRTDFASSDVFIQPRIAGAYSISENWKATVSWGLYKQYVARNPIVNDQNNLAFVWTIAGQDALQARHSLAGIAYSIEGFLISLEGYNKYTRHVTRFYRDEIYTTNVDIWGADVFMKKELGKSSVFASYSLTDVSEQNSETGHELKLGGILSVSPFYISSNFVYGRGLNVVSIGQQRMGQGQNNKTVPNGNYSRLDLAATYRLELKECTLQTGLSLINVFDTQNVKYDYSLGGKQDVVNVYTQAMPFTPMLFFEFLF